MRPFHYDCPTCGADVEVPETALREFEVACENCGALLEVDPDGDFDGESWTDLTVLRRKA